ncbi:P-loop containing nucleoside triphosphate hydrolase protein [Pseudomassariella vexata]|uniref:ATP-dependent RNA helicase n=1 Tax=Pseudomassariella vexata TaxID=1141098 RepID=A0A1Y2DK77_9PEZI|nr:P-loop containing nucleoside triphosphate hydrolase protein [Pseudomassariella vexata]ORY59632.1 P-loop containing nucleoside triphosphate hydrolase protein [Pseudomassariella vexata]
MADDGMLLNFEIGEAPIKPQVKFTGGRWRDRKHAERSARKNRENPWDGANGTPLANGRPSGNSDETDRVGNERPTKRQRIAAEARGEESNTNKPNTSAPKLLAYMTGKLPPGSISVAPRNGNQTARSGPVTSRLFTSNPTPKTVFEEPVVEAEPTQPSNAPLSEEAENFRALGLSGRIAQHLSSKLEMKAPTSIQKNAIPKLVEGDSDAFLQAQTGSGKTLAYLLPIVQRIMALSHNEDGTSTGIKIHRNSGLFAMILAPTRELCKQIAVVLEKLLRCAPWIVSTTVIGGESKKSEKARLRKGVNILIATPGRLTDHLDHTQVLDVGTVRWLVLDEGDRLMEMGFEDDLKTIIGKIRKEGLKTQNDEGVKLDALPQRRITVLCSATMKYIDKLGEEISLKDALEIKATSGDAGNDAEALGADSVFQAPSQLKQTYIVTAPKLRLVTLLALLKSTFARKGSVMKAIVFISCADSADFHFNLLRSAPASAASTDDRTSNTVANAAYITSPANQTITLFKLHGSLAQPVRTSTLNAFTTATDPAVLITTDISSRGLDVPAVDLVIEYDPAFSVDDHTHRIGRTARAGRPGKAVLFLQPGCEEGYVPYLKTNMSGQSADTVIQKGFITPITIPKSSTKETEAPILESEKSSMKRAEALQLHLEQRLLESDKTGSKLLDEARLAFRSHIRAYATHVKDEREFFNMEELQLGHMAKSFGLREAPSNIGGGPSRRAHKGGQQQQRGGSAPKRASRGGGGADDIPSSMAIDKDDLGAADEDAARRMKMKLKEVMGAASEFNIG